MTEFKYILLTILTLCTGCQSTGDPSKGGLFEWDEEQSKARQQQLKKDYEARRQELAKLQQTNNQKQLEEEQNSHKLATEQLKLTYLQQQQKLLTTNIQQLKIMLADNDRLKNKLKEVSMNCTSIINDHDLKPIDNTAAVVALMESRLQQTTREITLLIGH